jgi:hypothetical protein
MDRASEWLVVMGRRRCGFCMAVLMSVLYGTCIKSVAFGEFWTRGTKNIVEFGECTVEITLPKSVALSKLLLSNTPLTYNLYHLACTIEILLTSTSSTCRLGYFRE